MLFLSQNPVTVSVFSQFSSVCYYKKKCISKRENKTWKSHKFIEQGDDSEEFKEMLRRDERKFRVADVDRDDVLNFEEFTAFVHPEEYEHMKDIVTIVGSICPVQYCWIFLCFSA